METTVSSDERHKVYEYCRRQLSGKWPEVSESELIIKPVSNGFINQLFYCYLPEDIETEYNRVVVRFINEDLPNAGLYNLTHVLAISLIVSENNISPKLLSISPTGTISQFIECRYFNRNDDMNSKRVELLAQKLAKFHSLKIPIPRDGSNESIIDVFEINLFENKLESVLKEESFYEQMKRNKCKTLLSTNVCSELIWLKRLISELKSPLVLSHNDFNRRNTLVRESKNSSDVELFLIDFDWSNYNYRGIDLGQYFCTWGQIETDFGSGDFPTDQQMTVFIDAYISEVSKTFGDSYTKHAINSRESLIKESKVFTLFAFVKDILYCLWRAFRQNEIDLLTKAEIRLQCYSQLKHKIIKDYPITA